MFIKCIFHKVIFSKLKVKILDPHIFSQKSHIHKKRILTKLLVHMNRTHDTQLRFQIIAMGIFYNFKHLFKDCPATGFLHVSSFRSQVYLLSHKDGLSSL